MERRKQPPLPFSLESASDAAAARSLASLRLHRRGGKEPAFNSFPSAASTKARSRCRQIVLGAQGSRPPPRAAFLGSKQRPASKSPPLLILGWVTRLATVGKVSAGNASAVGGTERQRGSPLDTRPPLGCFHFFSVPAIRVTGWEQGGMLNSALGMEESPAFGKQPSPGLGAIATRPYAEIQSRERL